MSYNVHSTRGALVGSSNSSRNSIDRVSLSGSMVLVVACKEISAPQQS